MIPGCCNPFNLFPPVTRLPLFCFCFWVCMYFRVDVFIFLSVLFLLGDFGFSLCLSSSTHPLPFSAKAVRRQGSTFLKVVEPSGVSSRKGTGFEGGRVSTNPSSRSRWSTILVVAVEPVSLQSSGVPTQVSLSPKDDCVVKGSYPVLGTRD